jgi:hypothetical protein
VSSEGATDRRQREAACVYPPAACALNGFIDVGICTGGQDTNFVAFIEGQLTIIRLQHGLAGQIAF